MASNPMLQAVLLHQHHQTTTPYQPVRPVLLAMAKPTEEKDPSWKKEDDDEEGREEEGEGEEDSVAPREKEKKDDG